MSKTTNIFKISQQDYSNEKQASNEPQIDTTQPSIIRSKTVDGGQRAQTKTKNLISLQKRSFITPKSQQIRYELPPLKQSKHKRYSSKQGKSVILF